MQSLFAEAAMGLESGMTRIPDLSKLRGPIRLLASKLSPRELAQLPRKIEQANDFFIDTVVEAARMQSPKSGEILVYLSPGDFLRMAESGFGPGKAATVRSVLDAKDQFNDLPFLVFKHDGKGVATVVGHEGRHRARALQEAGSELIPVRLVSQGNRGAMKIRFGSQDNAFDSLALNGQTWPTALKAEQGAGRIEFPVPAPVVRE